MRMGHLIALAVATTACSPTTLTHGVPNYAVVDATPNGDPYVVRSGQITSEEGWTYLVSLAHGRKIHLIKLNYDAEGIDERGVALGMRLLYVPIQPMGDTDLADDVLDTFKTPDANNIARAKSELLYCKLHPDTDFCDVHCTHGQDRTGEVVGEYRVDDDDWTKVRAYAEMIAHHYHPELHGLHEHWERYQPQRAPVSP